MAVGTYFYNSTTDDYNILFLIICLQLFKSIYKFYKIWNLKMKNSSLKKLDGARLELTSFWFEDHPSK